MIYHMFLNAFNGNGSSHKKQQHDERFILKKGIIVDHFTLHRSDIATLDPRLVFLISLFPLTTRDAPARPQIHALHIFFLIISFSVAISRLAVDSMHRG